VEFYHFSKQFSLGYDIAITTYFYTDVNAMFDSSKMTQQSDEDNMPDAVSFFVREE